MLKELEKAIQNDLDKDFPEAKLKADFAKFKGPRTGPSVAEQLLAVAESVKAVQADIDAMQDEYIARISDIVGNMHDAMDALRDDLTARCDALRQNMGVRQ